MGDKGQRSVSTGLLLGLDGLVILTMNTNFE